MASRVRAVSSGSRRPRGAAAGGWARPGAPAGPAAAARRRGGGVRAAAAGRRKVDWQEASEALRTAKFPALAPLAVTSRVLVVDVRPEQQYRKAHAKGSVNVPLFRDIDLAKDGPLGALKAASLLSQGVPATQLNDEFVAQFTAAIGDAKEVVLADAEGGTLQRNEAFPLGKESRALIAAFKIREAGAGPAKLSHMEGGLNEWARANLPTEGEGEYVIEARTPQFSGAKADATAVAYEKVKAEGGLDDLGMGGLKRGPFWVALKQFQNKSGIFEEVSCADLRAPPRREGVED